MSMLGLHQCEWKYTKWMLLALAAHIASVCFRSGGKRSKIGGLMCGLLATIGIVMTYVVGVPITSYMHQVVGMVGFEYAARMIVSPMTMITTRLELLLIIAGLVPMLDVVVSETIC